MKVTIRLSACLFGGLLSILVPQGSGAARAASVAHNLACNGCVSARDLARSAKPGGADFSTASGPVVIPIATNVVVASVTMVLPGPGVVILNSGGYASITNVSNVSCGIAKRRTLVDVPRVEAHSFSSDPIESHQMSIATTRGFQESRGGRRTYFLVCTAGGINGQDPTVVDAILTAVFAPQRY